ncbi:hypothetical protein DPSP01_011415 [Paraphaeosphaeria sporulosa]|uniref:Uncharacterized protein n=1 Tax=Paraphaeosphaeria sporulosa TaxID=1460663 RepID=A0A177CGD2_9PLEO|nr:uncharacterized protein CC84DRAFT_1164584 [Paraphaeosphaeria sporulosa]OAG06281.1 hypothetical protein CC84DRAFT_1164584 [Paraphaeosphaeria sporulosa]
MSDLKPLTAFISGPLDPTPAYFAIHYAPKLDTAIAAGHNFIIGPVRGVDALALQYLLEKGAEPKRISVYMARFEFASSTWRTSFTSLGVNVVEVEDAVTTRERDAAMTRDSDYDILRYRTEEEARAAYGAGWWPRVSNTEMNERRRAGDESQEYRPSGEVEGGKAVKQEETKSKVRKLFRRK